MLFNTFSVSSADMMVAGGSTTDGAVRVRDVAGLTSHHSIVTSSDGKPGRKNTEKAALPMQIETGSRRAPTVRPLVAPHEHAPMHKRPTSSHNDAVGRRVDGVLVNQRHRRLDAPAMPVLRNTVTNGLVSPVRANTGLDLDLCGTKKSRSRFTAQPSVPHASRAMERHSHASQGLAALLIGGEGL